MRILLIALLLMTGCSNFESGEFLRFKDQTMDRAAYNKPLWGSECIFDIDGEATNSPCKDIRYTTEYSSLAPSICTPAAGAPGQCKEVPFSETLDQMINRNLLEEAQNTPEPDFPVRNHVYSTVSQTEEACFEFTGQYVKGCTDGHSNIYYTAGDIMVVKHELCHVAGGCKHL